MSEYSFANLLKSDMVLLKRKIMLCLLRAKQKLHEKTDYKKMFRKEVSSP